MEVLTVEQMLMYTAELKLPALTRAQQLERCDEVISHVRQAWSACRVFRLI